MSSERGGGRNRSEIEDLDRRLADLDSELDGPELQERAWLFTLEAYAFTLFQRFRAELFEARLGMPKTDTEVFSILQAHGVFDQVQARKLRQFCESRFLASRDLTKLDVPGLREMAADREWIRERLRTLGKTPS